MSEQVTSSKRIAKNTMMLYIRMGISIVIGLYTTRIVLNALGVDDYGIYGVVGGIVVFLGFINGAMSAASSRFLTFELGRKIEGRLEKTFVSAFWVHFAIAVIIVVLAETVGLWFLYNKLVIPYDRMNAALWVYQFSVLTTVVSITQVPYNASIISHEDMDLFAYAEIANSFLKLAIAYIVLICSTDKLILYAGLIFAESLALAMFYRLYCLKHYKECHISLKIDKGITKDLLSFCSWDLYGNLCCFGKDQGLSFIINIFFGVALNAGSSIATTVSGTLSGFTSNITMAIRPQIIKRYAAKNIQSMLSLLRKAIQYNILLQAFISVPLIFECHYLLKLWLGVVPPYAVVFCQIMLIASILRTVVILMNIAIQATGKIRRLNFISGSISLIQLPIIYVILKHGGGPSWCYLTSVIGVIVVVIVDVFILKKHISELKVSSIFEPYIYAILTAVLFSALPYFIAVNMEESFVRLIVSYLVYAIPLTAFTYFCILDKQTKEKINAVVMSKIAKK